MPASPERADAPPCPAPSGVRLFAGDGGVEVVWTPAPGADGHLLEVLGADGALIHPQPPVVYRDGGATVDLSAHPAGEPLRVRVRALSAPSGTAVLPAAPGLPRVGWREGELRATWDEAAGADGYEVHVLEGEGRLLAPQPGVVPEGAGAVIATDALRDGTAYGLRVRAVGSGGAGPWSAAAAFTLDRSRPQSPALAALRERLVAAGADLTLSPEVVGAAEVSRALALVAAEDAGLAVSGAAVSSDPESVTVEGDAALFGRTVRTSLRFTAGEADDALRLMLSAPLGGWDLGGLYAAGVLREPSFAMAPHSGLTLPAVALTLDSAAAELRLPGEPSPEPWDVLGLSGARLGPAAADLRVRLRSDGLRDVEPAVTTTLLLDGGLSLPVRLRVPHALERWRLALASSAPVPLPAVGALAPLLAGAGDVLPAWLRADDAVALAWLDVAWTPVLPETWDVWLGLVPASAERGEAVPSGSVPGWRLGESGPSLSRPSATVSVRVRPGEPEPRVMASGALRGILDAGGIEVEAAAELPADGDGVLVLRAAPGSVGGFAALAPHLGCDGDALAAVLRPAGTLGALVVERVEMEVDPARGTGPVRLSLAAADWTPPGEDDKAYGVTIVAEAAAPAVDGSRVLSGKVAGEQATSRGVTRVTHGFSAILPPVSSAVAGPEAVLAVSASPPSPGPSPTRGDGSTTDDEERGHGLESPESGITAGAEPATPAVEAAGPPSDQPVSTTGSSEEFTPVADVSTDGETVGETSAAEVSPEAGKASPPEAPVAGVSDDGTAEAEPEPSGDAGEEATPASPVDVDSVAEEEPALASGDADSVVPVAGAEVAGGEAVESTPPEPPASAAEATELAESLPVEEPAVLDPSSVEDAESSAEESVSETEFGTPESIEDEAPLDDPAVESAEELEVVGASPEAEVQSPSEELAADVASVAPEYAENEVLPDAPAAESAGEPEASPAIPESEAETPIPASSAEPEDAAFVADDPADPALIPAAEEELAEVGEADGEEPEFEVEDESEEGAADTGDAYGGVPADDLFGDSAFTEEEVAGVVAEAEADPFGEPSPEPPSPQDAAPGTAAPTGVVALYLAPSRRVTAEWEAVPGAEVYQAQLLDGTGDPLDPANAVATPATRLALEGGTLLPGVEYGLHVRAVADGQPGPWSEPAFFTPAAPEPPADLILSEGGERGSVTAGWSAAEDATGYRIQVLGPNGRALDPQPVITVEGTTAHITGLEVVEEGTTLGARIRTRAVNALGAWSPVASITLSANGASHEDEGEADVFSRDTGEPAEEEVEAVG